MSYNDHLAPGSQHLIPALNSRWCLCERSLEECFRRCSRQSYTTSVRTIIVACGMGWSESSVGVRYILKKQQASAIWGSQEEANALEVLKSANQPIMESATGDTFAGNREAF